MKKIALTLLFAAIVMLGSGVDGPALYASSFNIKIGLFHPLLQSDLWETNMENLAFDKKDMQNAYYGVEYEYFLNRFISFAFEGGYYYNEHNSFYRDYEYDDGSPIYQNLSLRIINLEADFKLYPIGHDQRFYPYLGGGAGLYFWRYEQWGDFIDFTQGIVNQDEYAETNTQTIGFNAKAGMVIRLSRGMGLALEGKYQYLKGELSSFFEGFEKLDLNGFVFTIGANFYL